MNALDVRRETHPLTTEENLEQVKLCTEIEKTTLLEEICRRQKSRVLYLREGDSNIRYFHKMANFNRRNSSIEESYG